MSIFRLSALGVGDCGFKSHFLDLGGGGCLFHNPEGSCNTTRFMHGTFKIIITRLSLKL